MQSYSGKLLATHDVSSLSSLAITMILLRVAVDAATPSLVSVGRGCGRLEAAELVLTDTSVLE
jgi:hypothetical protein